MHVYDPAAPPHETLLPAAVAAAPVLIDTAVIWLVEYVSVHSSPAGAVPDALRESGRVIVVPGLAVADESVRVSDCACRMPHICAIASPVPSQVIVVRRLISSFSGFSFAPGIPV